MDSKKPILVLGIGNLILKDEGFGVHVVQKMADMPLQGDVEVMDGGTMGLDLLYSMEGRKKVIVIDVVNADGPPGTLYRFTDKLELELWRQQHKHGSESGACVYNTRFIQCEPESDKFFHGEQRYQ